ncbi:MAG: hypothetical protein JWO36_3255 [Myxococcales bacterium]|nr:hypothetical protein [Myxococcales bacterium]
MGQPDLRALFVHFVTEQLGNVELESIGGFGTHEIPGRQQPADRGHVSLSLAGESERKAVRPTRYQVHDMRHAMKIGPIDLEKGSASAYVAFGESGLDVVLEPTDDKGLAALRRRSSRGEPLVCEPALSRSAIEHGLAVGKLPPEALAIKAALAVSFDHGPVMEHVAPQLVVELIVATIEFAASEPWNAFEPDEAIAIRFEPDGREVEGCVMGQAGEEFGLALYHHKGSIDKVMALAAEGRPEAARTIACTTVLIARDDSFAVDAVHEMTGVAGAPLVFHCTRGKPGPAGEQDIAALVAALRAVTALAQDGRQASGRSLGAEHTVVAHATRGASKPSDATRSAFEGVGRNQPCPCGSGKKFKRCHLSSVEAPPPHTSPRAALHARDERIVRDILVFGARRFGAEAIARGVDDTFSARRVSRQLVDPLLAYAWPIDGKSLAAHFLHAQGARLDADDRKWIELQLTTRLSVWEILRVEHGRGVEAVDLLSGDRCFVHEVMGSEVLAPRDTVLARVTVHDVAVFCGMHESLLAPAPADEIIASFRDGGLMHGDWAAAVRLIELWHGQLAAAERKAAAPMRLSNTDGHDVATIEDHFAVAGGALEPVLEKLVALEGVLVDERDRKGARLTFTRPGNAVHAWWKNTIVGSARLTPTRLIVSTNSIERAEALADRVRDVLGSLATWKKRTREELPTMLGGKTVTIDAQATDSPSASLLDAFRAWLDSPLPKLAGRCPREAVRDADGRRDVHLLLKDMEHHHARKPVDGFDPVQLRRELGLDEIGQPIPHLDLDRAVGAGRKLSETLLEFVRPLVDTAPCGVDEHRMRTLLGFAINVWNLVVTEELDGSEDGGVAEMRAELAPDRIPAEVLAWFDRLVARKRERFHGDLRLVGNWRVRQSRGRLDIEMESRVPRVLHAKLTAAGLLP